MEALESRCLLDNGGITGGLAEVGLTPGWATFGQVLAPGRAYGGVQIGNLPTQNDIKNYWADGSIKYVILTTFVENGGNYTLNAAAPYQGSFTPQVPEAYVWFVLPGDHCFAPLPTGWGEYDRWLSGPLVVEGRVAVVPFCNSGGTHPFLRVLMDYRAYADGEFRLDVTVENTLDVAGATRVTYDVSIVVADQTVFQRTNVQQAYLTRWRHVTQLGLPYQSQVTPDFGPAFESGALPYYLPIVTNRVNGPGGPRFDILGPGDLNPYMPDHSGRPEIAPYPDWTARYLVHRNPTQGDYVLAHGDLAGSWPIHARQPNGNLVSIDQRPRLWLDIPIHRGDDRLAGDLNATGPLTPDNAHQPSLAYVPYLVTGDRYYVDEMAFWANYVLISTFPGNGSYRGLNGEGYLWTNETRGFAWGFRNLIDAAAFIPHDDPRKDYLVAKVYGNLAWLENNALTNVGPLGVAWQWPIGYRGDNIYEDPLYTRVWQSVSQHNLLAWAVDHANKQGFAGGETFLIQMAQFNLDLLTNPLTRDGAAPYWTPIGVRLPPGSDNILWYTINEQTYNGPSQYPGYYGPDARLMCLVGLEYGLPGAQEAYDYLHPQLAIDIFQEFMPDIALRSGWAVSVDGMRRPPGPGGSPTGPGFGMEVAYAATLLNAIGSSHQEATWHSTGVIVATPSVAQDPTGQLPFVGYAPARTEASGLLRGDPEKLTENGRHVALWLSLWDLERWLPHQGERQELTCP